MRQAGSLISGSPLIRLALPFVGIALGLIATAAARDWESPIRWIPDVVAGVSFFALASALLARHRGGALLAVAAGTTWFAGTVFAEVQYWHRGPLVHLLIAFPAARVRGRVAVVAIAAGYLAAILPWAWWYGAPAIVLAVCLVAVLAVRTKDASGGRRVERMSALAAGSLYAIVVVAAAVAGWLGAGADVGLVLLLAYDAVIVASVVLLAVGVRLAARSTVLDLVVDLESVDRESVRDELAFALGDPLLQLGYWDADVGSYRTAEGGTLEADDADHARELVRVDRADGPFAAVMLDPSIADHEVLDEAVQRAAQLTDANADLRARTRARMDEVIASRRRIVLAGDDERRRIAQRVEQEVRAPLMLLAAHMSASPRREEVNLDRSVAIADEVLTMIERTISGLSPGELADGLAPAIDALCARSGDGVTWNGRAARLDPHLESALYHACAEVVTNAVKHADATSIHVEIDDADGVRLTIRDDGRGGADAGGSGLTGVRDRLATLGGTIEVISAERVVERGPGTTVVVAIPQEAIQPVGS